MSSGEHGIILGNLLHGRLLLVLEQTFRQRPAGELEGGECK